MRYFLLISYALILCLCLGARTSCKADDSPGFFVKISKNIPRLGRRSDKEFETGFLKNYKSIPHMGRSLESDHELSFATNWLHTPLTKTINKRVVANSIVLENDLTVVQPVNSNTLRELIDKHAIPGENIKFVHWKDFDRALQLDAELYVKVSSLGRRPDQRLRQDIAEASYAPLMDNMVDADGTNFILYNQGEYREGPYAPEFLRYNSM